MVSRVNGGHFWNVPEHEDWLPGKPARAQSGISYPIPRPPEIEELEVGATVKGQ